MHTTKYGRTYHYPFSPGTTSDDRIQFDYWRHLQAMTSLLHTEKLDGENNCLNRYGVFARSHVAATVSPWTSSLRQLWHLIKYDLGDIELFGENLYAIHSIEYPKLEQHYFVFGVRCQEMWLSWEEVCFYGAAFDLPTVPLLKVSHNFSRDAAFKNEILELASEPGVFGSLDAQTGKSCSREGVVSRNSAAFPVDALGENVFKYVRPNHVKTDEHWTRNWKRAALINEQKR